VPPPDQGVNLFARQAGVLDQVLHDVGRSPSQSDGRRNFDLFSAMRVQEELRSNPAQRAADGNGRLVGHGLGPTTDA
jgi:hypothetical protein